MVATVVLAALSASMPAQTPMTPDQALAELKAGNLRYDENKRTAIIPDSKERARLAEGQSPFVGFLSCADSRVPLELIFDQGPGRLFVVRGAGNVADLTAVASLQYGVAVLKTPLIVVMGHEACGAVVAAMQPEEYKAKLPAEIQILLQMIEPGVKAGDLKASTDGNVDVQVETLKKNPVFANAIKAGSLKIVGAYFDIKTGKATFHSH